ncbi:hypothetical protein VTJ83DRAFT_3489 [Remersonia thermophila]|uniref:Glutathione S-transferase n=1 Tax=Remersonia thermophila TaxID=72144 RepID=A0ABR4DE44_9PEZI
MPYHLYIANKNYSSWSLRPWLLLRQLGIPFVEHFRPLNGNSYRQPQWREFSPTGHVPCLHVLPPSPSLEDGPSGRGDGEAADDDDDDDGDAIVVWESLAIAEYLADAHPTLRVWPACPRARAWARSACAEMCTSFQAVRNQMGMNVGLRIALDKELFALPPDEGEEEEKERLTDLGRDLARLDALWREGLGRFGGPFLAGAEFTAVDAWFAPVVLRIQTYGAAMERLGEEAKGYVRRMLALEGVQEWVEAAHREKERMELYERDCTVGKGRRLVEDLRVKGV